MQNKPNIVYIFSDQHRGDTMGSVGHPSVITPNLDRIASEGVNFTNCFTNSPLCMPARASMMSGEYVREHGVWDNNLQARSKGPSHVRNIRNAGYHTGLIGKTHLWIHGARKEPGKNHTRHYEHILKDWGFEYIHELTGPIATIANDSYYTDYLEKKGLLEKHRKYMIEYAVSWQRGEALPWEEPPCPLDPEDHLDAYTGQKAADWISEYKGDKPFYLQVLFPGPHDPFDSPQKYRDMYDPKKMPLGIMDYPADPIPPYVQMVLAWSNLKGMTALQKQLIRTFYYGKVTLIDEYIGKIYRALEDKGLLDNTWIVYNSDHGEMLGDHMMSHKIVFYDQAIRIPCIFRPPGGVEGRQLRTLADQIDVAASLLDIAGAKPLENSDGRSLIPRIEAGPAGSNNYKGKEVVFSEVFGYTMVRNDRYKLVVQADNLRPVEMYDLYKDPEELMNQVDNQQMGSIRTDLINNHLKRITSRMDIEKYELLRKTMRETNRGPAYARGISWFGENEK